MRRLTRVAVVAAVLLAAATPVSAHDVSPESVLKLLNGAAVREAAGVVRAGRDPKLPRLLLVEVGDGWWALPASRRAELARDWRALWRHGLRQGVVSVVDALTGEPVVSYRPDGEATVQESRPTPAPAPSGPR